MRLQPKLNQVHLARTLLLDHIFLVSIRGFRARLAIRCDSAFETDPSTGPAAGAGSGSRPPSRSPPAWSTSPATAAWRSCASRTCTTPRPRACGSARAPCAETPHALKCQQAPDVLGHAREAGVVVWARSHPDPGVPLPRVRSCVIYPARGKAPFSGCRSLSLYANDRLLSIFNGQSVLLADTLCRRP